MDSFAFPDRQQQLDGEPVSKLRHNSRTKLRIKFSHVLERDNTVHYLHCQFQSLTFSVRYKTKPAVSNSRGNLRTKL